MHRHRRYGGLMGTAMSARNYAGAIIDGGVRDVAYLQKIGFPSLPGHRTVHSVHHYRSPVLTCRWYATE